MADKKLNISADLRIKTGDADRVLKRLEKEGVKISNILKGLDLNTSTGRGGFAKQLMMANKEMVKLKGTTHDTAKVMQHVYGKELERQTKNLERYTKAHENLTRKFKTQQYNANFQREIGNNEAADRLDNMANRTARRSQAAFAGAAATRASIDEMKGAGKMDKGMVLAIAQAVAAGIQQVSGYMQSRKTMEASNTASVMGVPGSSLRRYAAGDWREGAFHMRTKGVGAQQFSGTGWNDANQIAGAASSALTGGAKAAAAYATGGASALLLGTGGTELTSAVTGTDAYWNKGGRQAAEAAAIQGGTEAELNRDPYTNMVMESLGANATGRRDASRRLGGRHMGMAFAGHAGGLSGQEGMAAATAMANTFGGGFTTGGGFGQVMGATAKGFDTGAATNIIGSFEQAGKGKGGEEFKRFMAAGVKAGLEGVNIQFFEKFGQAIASQAVGANGAVSGGNFSTALMHGIIKNSNMADVQGNISGQAALSNAMNGGGFMQGMGQVLAKNILGGGGSGVQMMALNSASLRDLMADSNEELDALGIGGAQRKELARGKIESLVRSRIGRDTSEGRYILDGAEGAGGLSNFLSSDKKGQGLVASILKANDPGSFPDYKTALGAARFMGGMNASEAKGGTLGNQGDGMAISHIQTQSKIMMQIWSDETKKRDEIIGAMRFSLAHFANLKDIQPGLDAAEKAVEIIERVYLALKKFDDLENGVSALEKRAGVSRPEKRTTFAPQPVGPNSPGYYSPTQK